jgi:L-alanine-DL-glutamate epimerase-like enolase superfamily enzyme
VYHDYLAGKSFDIVQPHLQNLLSDLRKIGAAAELANVDCIFHGHHGMDLIGSLQVGATIRSCTMQEIVFTTPGILPEEAWSPLAVLVKTPQLLEVEGGVVKIPTAPGLGIEVDDEAVERFRVRDGEEVRKSL